MGHYTTLARFASMAARSPRNPHRPVGRSAAPGAEVPACRFECPGCGDGSDVEARCPRCDLKVRPTSGVAEFRPAETAAERAPMSMSTVIWGLGMGLGFPAIALAAVAANARYEGLSATNPVFLLGAVFIGLAFFATSAIFAYVRGRHLLGRLRRAAAKRRAARRRDRLSTLAPCQVPVDSSGPVRVRGEVRVTEGQVHVVSEQGRVRVPVDARVRVYGEDDDGYLVDGQAVDVVGAGARAGGGDGAYRSAEGEFVFDVSKPLEVWVR